MTKYLDDISDCLVSMQMAVDLAAQKDADPSALWSALEYHTQRMAFIAIQASEQSLVGDQGDTGHEPDFDFGEDEESLQP